MQILRALDAVVDKVMRWSVIGSLVGILLILAFGVIGRMFPIFNQSAYPEVIELLFTWATFLGAAMLWRERALLRVDFVMHMLPRLPAWCLKIVIELGMLIFALLLVYYGWDFATAIVEYTPFLHANRVYWYLSIPLSGAIMAAYSIAALCELMRSPTASLVAHDKQQEII